MQAGHAMSCKQAPSTKIVHICVPSPPLRARLLMSTCSQYRASLRYNANLFLHLHPEGADMLDGLKADMVELQQQVRPALQSQAGSQRGLRQAGRHSRCTPRVSTGAGRQHAAAPGMYIVWNASCLSLRLAFWKP